MAVRLKQLLFPLLLLSFILVDQAHIAEAFIVEADTILPKGKDGEPAPAALDCGGLCRARCRLHSRPNLCMRACATCCFRCKCVPPGTSGNSETCSACYTDMTTHGNRTKCP